MPFTLERFCEIRPYLFHLTATGNLNRILTTRTLQPASELLAVGGWRATRTHPRGDHQIVEIEGQVVWIRDQQPLHAGNIAFEPGWDMPRWLAHIDEHVFFWPGTHAGPIKSGLNHRARYADESAALLRVPSRALVEANHHLEPLFCRFNSGAPRTVAARKSPRGSSTYVSAQAFEGSSADVVEMVFTGDVRLPPATALAADYVGRWGDCF